MSTSNQGQLSRVKYTEVSATQTMRDVPRFGHSSSFADLFGSKEESTDYIEGLLFGGILCACVFFAWWVALLTFKCLGKRKVGFLSGSAFVRPADHSVDYKRPFVSRLCFLNAYILFLVFTVLFVTQGLTNLEATVDKMIQSSRNIDATFSELDSITAAIDSVGQNASNVTRRLFALLNDGSAECLTNETIQQETGRDFMQLIQDIRTTLNGLGNYTIDNQEEFEDSIEFIGESSQDVQNQADNIDIGDWQSLIVIIPYIIIPSLLLAGVALAWLEMDVPRYRCLLSWLVLPIFIFLTLFAALLSCGMMIAASANADFCSGGTSKTPDGTVFEILSKRGYTEDDLVFQIVDWYVGQCISSDPFGFVTQYSDEIEAAIREIGDWVDALSASGDLALTQVCSTEVVLLTGLSRIIQENVNVLLESTLRAIELLRCANIINLYTDPVYDGTCTYSVTGVTWAFASFIVVGTMGTIMIMLRSSWQLDVRDSEIFDNKINGQDEYGGYTTYQGGLEEGLEEFDAQKKDIGEDNNNGNPQEEAPYEGTSGSATGDQDYNRGWLENDAPTGNVGAVDGNDQNAKSNNHPHPL